MHELRENERENMYENNFSNFDNFAMFNRDKFNGYGIVYLKNRDSGPLEESNYAVVLNELAGLAGWEYFSAGHWGVGYVDGFAVIYNSPAWAKIIELLDRMNDYPILDEDDFNQREFGNYRETVESYYMRDCTKKIAENFGYEITDEVFWTLWDYWMEETNGDYNADNIDGERVYQYIHDFLVSLNF